MRVYTLHDYCFTAFSDPIPCFDELWFLFVNFLRFENQTLFSHYCSDLKKNSFKTLQQQKSALNICPEVARTGDVNSCPYSDKCRFSHDMEAFLAQVVECTSSFWIRFYCYRDFS